MKNLLVLMFVSMSLPAFAHSGHGSSDFMIHNIEHGVWLIAAMAVLAIVFVLRGGRSNQSSAKERSSSKIKEQK